jgi:hypothetical protein
MSYRAHAYRGRKREKKGLDENAYIRLLDVAHQQLGGPIVVVWDNLGTHRSARMRRYLANRNWPIVFHLQPPTHPNSTPSRACGHARNGPWPNPTKPHTIAQFAAADQEPPETRSAPSRPARQRPCPHRPVNQ